MKGEEEFDAVRMMRELRQAVDDQLVGKSYEEQRRYLDEHVQVRQKQQNKKKGRKAV